MINILLVDDHELVRTGVNKILNEVKGFKVIDECETGEDAVKFCRMTEPDVILMDMDMPGMGGLEATKKILRLAPEVKVIILTAHTEDPFPTKVMKIGAAGYLTKGAGPNEMINAIRAVNSGQRYLPPAIAQQMALSQFKTKDENPFSELSDRELQIMLMITRGEKVPDISEHLHLSPKTINSYRYRMFDKLNVGNDVELTHLAIRHGMINTEKL
ncbi:UvrY/SirA/GacA family response regulator transcription factor [Colwellia sp. 4_MG-2023]|uniref:UvrY/SirA/GacA family response regulator transcription factor n=1 Tax=unclassified Colwellia TaxID=196834 RepID=UPI001C083B7F|nr:MULTISPECIES: UvrY/SirA/GacA family response regulator transcription factor [unclassified Colwellia]MBU2925611.1 UvrY/SirA/GacA family response regulator transcription factor [Colwellia sp. C2M11]MDO6489334.1 UvrY/SirA/GacA family response regulator transcription factor [Colwellia sp. 6_MG-2023]MDO6507541.1 UvrY/SirA/GacA family response regulator transcription factor [Colwellia sp. 5_MG-2023]MDO6556201.1 UvrY/SirA/GacA family response regulator transcription factor [Colwellia sp. 4_MG-2023]